MKFVKRSEGFEDKKVNTSLNQSFNLLPERVACFLPGDFSQRLDTYSQRPHCPCHKGLKTLCCLPCEAGTRQIDVANLICTTMPRQPKAVAPKSIRFYDFGSSVQVVLVDAQDQLRLGEIKLVITAVNKDPSGIKKGAHCAIAQNRMRRENPDKS